MSARRSNYQTDERVDDCIGRIDPGNLLPPLLPLRGRSCYRCWPSQDQCGMLRPCGTSSAEWW
jgi:hypothetical protein